MITHLRSGFLKGDWARCEYYIINICIYIYIYIYLFIYIFIYANMFVGKKLDV